MADADKTLKLLIEMGVVGQDAVKAANDTLDRTAEATNKFGAETKKAGEDAAEANHHHEGMRQIFSEMNRIVPELGHVLHAAFAGPLGPIILVSLALSEARSKLKEYNEELDKEGAAAYEPHLAALETIKTAWEDAIGKFAEYQGKLAEAGDKDPIKTQIDNAKALAKAQIDADKEIIESEEKKTEAYIRANGAKTGKSQEQIDLEVSAARTQSQGLLGALNGKAAGLDAKALQDELDRRKAAAPGLGANADAATTAANAASLEVQRKKEEFDRLHAQGLDRPHTDADIEALRKTNPESPAVKAYDAQKKYRSYQDPLDRAAANPSTTDKLGIKGPTEILYEEMAAHAKAEYDKYKQIVDSSMTEFQQLQKQLPEAMTAAQKAEAAAATAQGKNDTNTGRLDVLPTEISQAQAIAAIAQAAQTTVQQNAAATQTFDNLQKLFSSGKSPQDILGAGARADDDLQSMAKQGFTPDKINSDYQQAILDQQSGHGTALDAAAIERFRRLQADQEPINELNELLKGLGDNAAGLKQIIGYHQTHFTTLGAEIAALQRDMQIIMSRTNQRPL